MKNRMAGIAAKGLMVLHALVVFGCKSPITEIANIPDAGVKPMTQTSDDKDVKKIIPAKIEEVAATKKEEKGKPKLHDVPDSIFSVPPIKIELKKTPPKKFKVHE